MREVRDISLGKRAGDIHIPMADSHCCMAETNTTLQSNYPPIKKKIEIIFTQMMYTLNHEESKC